MQITKFPQSNFLIEKDKTRILIDPGIFTFEKFTNDDFGKLDAIFISHRHPDHCHTESLKYWSNHGIKIYCNDDVAKLLKDELVKVIRISAGDGFTFSDLNIKAIYIPHCKILFCTECQKILTAETIRLDKKCHLHPDKDPHPIDGPLNTGFLIDRVFFHSGDGITMENPIAVENAAIPIAGPTIDYVRAWKFAESLKSKKIIPMHYSNPKYPADPVEFARQGKPGIEVKILADSESLEI